MREAIGGHRQAIGSYLLQLHVNLPRGTVPEILSEPRIHNLARELAKDRLHDEAPRALDEALKDDDGPQEADEFVPSALVVIFDQTSHAVAVVGALHASNRLELTPCIRLVRDLDLQDQ
jgi:hypothetical protein